MLDRHQAAHPWPVAAIRLLTLTGARVSEVLHLAWNAINDLGDEGASARLADSKTGPRTIWFGPEAARLLAALPRLDEHDRVFPEHLTAQRLQTFWRGVREDAGLPGLRLRDCRHTAASQAVMSGEGLQLVGKILGHRRNRTTAGYAHLADAHLVDTAEKVGKLIAEAMAFA